MITAFGKATKEVESIDSLQPKTKRYFVPFIEEGVEGRVGVTGNITLYYRYKINDISYPLKLGVYPKVSKADLEKQWKAAMGEVAKGNNPKLDKADRKREQEEESQRLAKRRTLAQVAKEWLAAKESEVSEVTYKGYAGVVRREIKDHELGKKVIEEITTPELIEFIKVIREDRPVAAGNTRRVLTNIFNWAVTRTYIPYSVAAYFPKGKAAQSIRKLENPKRKRWLRDNELRLIWNNLDSLYNPLHAEAIRQYILTGQRRTEIVVMHRSQIDDGWWVLSEDQVKTDERHTVWLARPVEGEEYIFRNRCKKSGNRFDSETISPDTLSDGFRDIVKLTGLDKGTDLTPRLSDCRRTLVTRVSQQFNGYVAHRMVNHAMDGSNKGNTAIDQTYNQNQYEKEKKQAWIWWANYISIITSDDNIVPFRQKSA